MTLARSFGQLFSHISARRRWQFAVLALLMLLGVVAEMATLGAVVPFLALLADPGLAKGRPFLRWIFASGQTVEQMQLAAAVAYSCIALAGAGLRIVLTWFTYRVSYGLGSDLASEVYRRTLYQPYAWHVSRNSGEILAGIQKVNAVTFGVIVQAIQGFVAVALCIAILATLLLIDPILALTAAAGFTILYGITTFVSRGSVRRNGNTIAQKETKRVQAIQEGLGGIRDVLLDGAQPVYCRRFEELDYAVQRARASNAFIAASPRFFVESTGMILIVVLAYWLSVRQGGLIAGIPTLGALAIGAQKLLPQMQTAYSAWSTILGTRQQLEDVLELLGRPLADDKPAQQAEQAGHIHPSQSAPPLLALKHVSFRYSRDGGEILRDVSISIPSGARIGVVGKTGSGKSTLIDLIMGLLQPTAGRIEVDGVPLTEANCRNWQARIAHVPQAIYLSDASVAENVAFGVSAERIDMALVREAARRAQLDTFIESLPDGYHTPVGERGIRLSGGQRQRIGLARALYKKADVLVLDEATSALDHTTEHAVIGALAELGRDVTVLMIAHRLSTLAGCDPILLLEAQRPPRWVDYASLVGAPLIDIPQEQTTAKT